MTNVTIQTTKVDYKQLITN